MKVPDHWEEPLLPFAHATVQLQGVKAYLPGPAKGVGLSVPPVHVHVAAYAFPIDRT